MRRVFHGESGPGAQPVWLRLAALFCVLWVSVAGIAQAAHIHGDWLPTSGTQLAAHVAGSSAIGEDSCPLCVAMHSALPTTVLAVLALGLLLELNLLLASAHKPTLVWYFAAFSRPPPSLLF